MARKMTIGVFLGVGLAVALALAFFVSPYASSSPDGLEKVAADKAIDTGVKDHTFADGPLADYAVDGVDNEKLSTGVAGIIGVTITFAIGTGLFFAIKAARKRGPITSPANSGPIGLGS
ncbi:MAG: PDGLE domain-containing protein [Acidimicrobiia bacterium]